MADSQTPVQEQAPSGEPQFPIAARRAQVESAERERGLADLHRQRAAEAPDRRKQQHERAEAERHEQKAIEHLEHADGLLRRQLNERSTRNAEMRAPRTIIALRFILPIGILAALAVGLAGVGGVGGLTAAGAFATALTIGVAVNAVVLFALLVLLRGSDARVAQLAALEATRQMGRRLVDIDRSSRSFRRLLPDDAFGRDQSHEAHPNEVERRDAPRATEVRTAAVAAQTEGATPRSEARPEAARPPANENVRRVAYGEVHGTSDIVRMPADRGAHTEANRERDDSAPHRRTSHQAGPAVERQSVHHDPMESAPLDVQRQRLAGVPQREQQERHQTGGPRTYVEEEQRGERRIRRWNRERKL